VWCRSSSRSRSYSWCRACSRGRRRCRSWGRCRARTCRGRYRDRRSRCRRWCRPRWRAVSPAGVHKDAVVARPVGTTPDNHFTAGPHRRVLVSGMGYVDQTRCYPRVRAGTVSATSIQAHSGGPEFPAPDDHFRAISHRGVRVARRGGVGSAHGHPTIRAWVVSAAGV